MPLYRDEALILRTYDLGESDRIVSFFGRRYGRVRVVAKGAKKLKSRFAGRLEPFQKVDIVFFGRENASLFKLSSVEISYPLTALSSDLEKFFRAYYLIEMVQLGLREGDPNRTAFDAVEKTLVWFDRQRSPQDFEWITRFFDIKFLSAMGYRPTLECCISCRKELPEKGQPSFDADRGGLLCPSCGRNKRDLMPISMGSAKFLAKILETGFEKAERLKPSQALLEEISRVIIAFRNSRLQAVFKTERYLNI